MWYRLWSNGQPLEKVLWLWKTLGLHVSKTYQRASKFRPRDLLLSFSVPRHRWGGGGDLEVRGLTLMPSNYSPTSSKNYGLCCIFQWRERFLQHAAPAKIITLAKDGRAQNIISWCHYSNNIKISAPWRRGYFLRNASSGDFVVVRTS